TADRSLPTHVSQRHPLAALGETRACGPCGVRASVKAMHINTLFYRALKAAGAGSAWVALDWDIRRRVLTMLYDLAPRALVSADDWAEHARQEVGRLAGSPLVGELAGKAVSLWARDE